MKTRTLNKQTANPFSDEQVFEALRQSNPHDQMVLHAFFTYVHNYALSYLMRVYPGLEMYEWDTILSNTDEKLIRRVKNGLTLNENIRLSTYYTNVAKFAALDFLSDRGKTEILNGEESQHFIEPKWEDELDKTDHKKRIRTWLLKVVGNTEQVEVLLLYSKGYTYREIAIKTAYESEGACRNAFMKGKQKIAQHVLNYPKSKDYIVKLLNNEL